MTLKLNQILEAQINDSKDMKNLIKSDAFFQAKASTKLSDTYEVVSTAAYMLGVAEKYFNNEHTSLDPKILQKLAINEAATVIRNLCMLRNSFEYNFKQINIALKNFTPAGALKDLLPVQCFAYLEKHGCKIIEVNMTPQDYIIKINTLISENIHRCKECFEWFIEWKYIKKLFIMPNGHTIEGIKIAAEKFYNDRRLYPFGVYVANWTFKQNEGNILYNDEKFLTLLYAKYGTEFNATQQVKSISLATKQDIEYFFNTSQKVVFMVDCENADAYKTSSVVNNLSNNVACNKISKIFLCNDTKASAAWNEFKNYTTIKVENHMTERINAGKSVVDHTLAFKIAQEIFQNGVDSIVLFSSDSDFWSVISGATGAAKFLVLLEKSKLGNELKKRLENAKIPYAYADDFGGRNSAMVKRTIDVDIQEMLKQVSINLSDMLDQSCKKNRLFLDKDEKERMLENYKAKVQFRFNDYGNGSLQLRA